MESPAQPGRSQTRTCVNGQCGPWGNLKDADGDAIRRLMEEFGAKGVCKKLREGGNMEAAAAFCGGKKIVRISKADDNGNISYVSDWQSADAPVTLYDGRVIDKGKQ